MAAGTGATCCIEVVAGAAPAVVAAGEIDVASAPVLARALDQALDHGVRPVTIDLTGVQFIDASVLGVLAKAQAVYGADGDQVVRVTGASFFVARVFRIAEMDHLLAA